MVRTILAVVLLACCGVAGADEQIDLAIVHGKVWTGNPDQPEARTILIAGDRIVKVGGDELATGLAETVKIIDADGRRVVPGLADCHTHIISGGLARTRLQLRDATGREDFVRRVADWSSKLKPGVWVVGRGWSVESWSDQGGPTVEWIDEATDGHPALLTRMDGHQALANSKALKLAAITKEGPPDPVGGQIVRDPETGQPTGILKDAAVGLVSKLIPAPDESQKTEALIKAMGIFNRHGVTMVHDMSSPSDGAIFASAFVDQNKMDHREWLRIYSFCSRSGWSKEPCFKSPKSAEGWVISAGFKGYMDGSLGSRTAYMREPFLDNPQGEEGARGLLMAFAAAGKPNDMLSQLLTAAAGDLQPAIHAIGDEANHLLLDAYAELTKKYPRIRPRIEHVQHLVPGDIARFKSLGVVASMQPLHKADDGRYAEKRLGYERCKTSYAFRSLLDSGAVVCFGSDWPVVSNNPFLGIEAAVTAKTLDGKVFVPEQNITVQQALRCYSANAARACFMEDRWGMIKPGFLADIIILDQDVLTVQPDRIGQTKVDLTLVGGKVAWERPHGS